MEEGQGRWNTEIVLTKYETLVKMIENRQGVSKVPIATPDPEALHVGVHGITWRGREPGVDSGERDRPDVLIFRHTWSAAGADARPAVSDERD